MKLPSSNDPKVSIVIILYNQAELTFACLSSIASSLFDSVITVEVVILDNNSTDRTPQLLDRIDGATILRSEENLHFLRGVNRAARDATGEFILLLNNDAQLVPGAVESALGAFLSDSKVGAVGGRLILPDGTLQEAGSIIWNDGSCVGYGRGRSPTDPEFMFRRDVDFCSGAFLMTPREVFEHLGGFDERYAPAYYEETDYCVRLWKNRLKVVYEPSASVLHYEFGSSSDTRDAVILMQKNQALFAERHRGWIRTQFANSPDNMLDARSRNSGIRLLMIEDRVPKIALGSGFPRANALLHEFVAAGAQVTLFPMVKHDETWTEVRDAIDARVEVFIASEAGELRALLQSRRGHFDAILVCRPHNMRYFLRAVGPDAGLLGDAKILYDAEAIFTARTLIQRSLKGETVPPEEARRELAEEISLARGADAVISVSPAESEIFRDHGIDRVYVIGHQLEASPTLSTFEQRSDILFVGAIHGDESPNADSLLWFASEILPRLRQRLGREIRLQVVGLNDAASVKALDGSALELAGQLSDLAAVFEKARVFVAPTRFAAGIPHKVHQAAALGVPVVTTELIAEQIGWKPGRDLLTGADAESFAEACARLYREKELWLSIRDHAAARCREECSQEVFSRSVRAVLETIPIRIHHRTSDC